MLQLISRLLLLLLLLANLLLALTAEASRPSVPRSECGAIPPSGYQPIRSRRIPPGTSLSIGGSYQNTSLFVADSFTVAARCSHCDDQKVSGATFQARIVGPTITTVFVNEKLKCPGEYLFEYEVRDPGEYRLQIRLSWFTGALTYADKSAREVGPLYRYQASDYVDYIVYDAPFTVHLGGVPDAEALKYQSPAKPQCRGGDSPGRWVKVRPPSCPPWVCFVPPQAARKPRVPLLDSSGTSGGFDVEGFDPTTAASTSGVAEEEWPAVEWLTDRFRLNDHWVWTPYSCAYRMYPAEEVRRELRRRRLSLLNVYGDSLVREHVQNLHSYLYSGRPGGGELHRIQGDAMVLPIPLVETSESQPSSKAATASAAGIDSLQLLYSFTNERIDTTALCSQIAAHAVAGGGMATLWNPPLLMIINSGFPVSIVTRRLLTKPNAVRLKCLPLAPRASSSASGPLLRDVLFIHPRVQRLDLRHINGTSPHTNITPLRQMLVMREAIRVLRGKGTTRGSGSSGPGDLWYSADMWEKAAKDADHKHSFPVLDGFAVTETRWEASWDGLHYSVLARDEDFSSPSGDARKRGLDKAVLDAELLRPGQFRRGGHDMCGGVLEEIPSHNRCSPCSECDEGNTKSLKDSSAYGINRVVDDTDDRAMHWRNRVVNRRNTFNSFEGGVSRMMTMMWVNVLLTEEA